jgi:hypothetical protein
MKTICLPPKANKVATMLKRNRGFAVAVLIAGAWFLIAGPVKAQIATTLDPATGKVVYQNGDSPTLRRRSTISSSLSASAAGASAKNSITVPVGQPPDELDRIVQDAATRHNVDPALVKAVITTESGWNPKAVSNKGAVGLMQLIPGTAQRFGVGNSLDPAQNIEGGTTYLKSLLDRYQGDLPKTLAAYNAGEHAVDLSGGVPAYPETQKYVQKVTNTYFRPGSGRNLTLWKPPSPPVRRVIDANGRLFFTNQ